MKWLNNQVWSPRCFANHYFGVDLRVLGLFRIVLGLTVLLQLVLLFPQATYFLSTDGVLPGIDLPRSLHDIHGSPEWSYFLFFLHAVVALLFLVGFWTRTANVLTWLMTVSLFTANPFINHLADNILCLLVFWSIFVPVNARYSLDASFQDIHPETNFYWNMGTIALLAQMPLVYFFAGFYKFQHPQWWPELHATYYVFQPKILTAFGYWIASVLPLFAHKILTLFTLVLELIGPILLFLPTYFFINEKTSKKILSGLRLGVFVAFSILQLFLFLTARLELFPIVSTVGMVPFLRFEHFKFFLPSRWNMQTISTGRGTQNAVSKDDSQTKQGSTYRMLSFICALVFSYGVWSNIKNQGVGPRLPVIEKVTSFLYLEQDWNIFTKFDSYVGFYEIEAHLSDGRILYIYDGGSIETDSPREDLEEPEPMISKNLFRSMRWRMYLRNFRTKRYPIAKFYGDYVCREWEREVDLRSQLKFINFLYVARKINPELPRQMRFTIVNEGLKHRKFVIFRYQCANNTASFFPRLNR